MHACKIRMATDSVEDCLVPETEDSQYETIGGKSAKIVRRPSLLASIQERGGLSVQRTRSQSSSPSDISSVNESIARWEEDDIMSWLHEIGFDEYKVFMNLHS